LVDIVDIVTFLVKLSGEHPQPDEGGWNFKLVFDDNIHFAKTPIKEIADISQRNPFVTVPKGTKLSEVVHTLALGAERGVHRACVVDENGQVESIVTQSGIINFLYNRLNHLSDPKLEQTVEQLKLGLKPVISVNCREKTLDALRVLHKERISGVAVLNDDGTLLTNFSGQDLKVLLSQDPILHLDAIQFQKLLIPLQQFISLAANMDAPANVRSPIFIAHQHETLRNIIGKLSTMHCHRLFVSDESRKPLGVIALRDVLEVICQS